MFVTMLIEVDYLMQEEFALFLEDITERRTKLYLYLDENNLKEWAIIWQKIGNIYKQLIAYYEYK